MTRCLVDNFLPQNIVYEAKVITSTADRQRFEEEIKRLDSRYLVQRPVGERKIPSVTASVGAELIIEFTDLKSTTCTKYCAIPYRGAV